jgi:hypothetical protein
MTAEETDLSAKAIAFGDRKKLARETKVSVVKRGLSSRLHDSVRDQILPVIESTIGYVSMACFRGSRVLNHVVARCLNDDAPVPDIMKDSYVDAR